MFHKYLLGVPVNSINLVVLGELGRQTFNFHCNVKFINGWLRILSHEDNRYTKLCYYEQFRLAENNTPSWGLRIKMLLQSLGFGFVWLNQGVGDVKAFLQTFRQRLLDINLQNWMSAINSASSLRTYVMTKTEYYIEPYILNVDKFIWRRSLARLRCASLDIGVNRGRKNGVPFELRKCDYCQKSEIDDEYHFIIICPHLDNIRIKYIPSFYTRFPTREKFSILLKLNSKKEARSISLFIIHALKHRANYVNN